MAHIDFVRRQLTCKLVYCGPGLSGKTTNLEVIHAGAPPDRRGELCSIATQSDRTLFFDYMPIDLRRTGDGLGARLMIYTVPGQSYYASTRTLVLQGVDGIVFVADSAPGRLQDNVEAFADLERCLGSIGLSLETTPLVFQWNKQDLSGAVPPLVLAKTLNRLGAPAFPAVALRGEGVIDTLKAITRLVLDRCEAELRPPSPAGLDEPPAPGPPAQAPDEQDLRARPTVLDDPEPEAAPPPEPPPAPPAPAPPIDAPRGVPADRSCPWSSSDRLPPPSDDPVIGQTVGGCMIHSHLGEGGMGAVYLARHTLLGKDVVVKVLKPQFATNQRRVERFFLEARAAAKLEHENVVRVQDVGTNEHGLHYIVMQYVEGTNLDQRIRERGAHDPDEATRIVLEVTRALEALHAAGMIHRDVKPENVVVTPTGGVKLIDFGLVKDLNCDLGLTRHGALIGTPAYIAPEIGRAATIDGRADIDSLGLTYYYLLTGCAPFQGFDVHDVIFGRARLRRPEALNPAVRPEHRRVLSRMVARKREARYPDATALRRDLEALLAGRAPEAGDGAEDVWAVRTPSRGERRAAASGRAAAAAAPRRPRESSRQAPPRDAAPPREAAASPPPAPRPSSGRQRKAGSVRRAAPAEVVEAMKDPARRLGRWVLYEVVDAAGAGVLHRAWDVTRAAPVLLRTLDGVRRVPPEAKQRLGDAAKLRHPAVAPVREHGTSDGRFFVVFDAAEREGPVRTLEALGASLAPEEVARVGLDIASALAHAHERGLVHGAITATSILVEEGGRAMLLDFGVAPVEATTPVGRARLGARLERAGCLAPEADPGEPGAPAEDVYAVGAVLWRALVGKPPSSSSSASGSGPQVEPDLLAICRRCLEPDPARRYPTAAELARDLDRFLVGEPPRAAELPLLALARRAPPAALAGAIVLAVLLGVVVGSAWHAAASHDPPSAPPAAAVRTP